MTRVLCWNVKNFGSNGFFPSANTRQRTIGDDQEYNRRVPAASADALSRRTVLLGLIAAVQPELISIVEVGLGQGNLGVGELAVDTAALQLLAELHQMPVPGAHHYALVPPLISGAGGFAEGAAVYYRSDVMHFLGPYGWSGVQAEPMAEFAGPETLAMYAEPWNVGLPARPIPEGWPNAGFDESRLAAQCTFSDAEGMAIHFPVHASRAPYLTVFADVVANRLIKLLSCHTSPGTAIQGTQRLAQITEITGPIEANEVRCVIGDFNVSSDDPVEREEGFGPLEAAGSQLAMQFDPAAAGVEVELPWAAYYYTHLLHPRESHPWISEDQGATQQWGYPGFGYIDFLAIDNALTRHGGAAGVPANQTVCNPIARSPYGLDPARPEAIPTGTTVVPSALVNEDIFEYDPEEGEEGIDYTEAEEGNEEEEAAEQWALLAKDLFQQWDNYTHVYSCSDHLPIALDI